MSNSIDVRGQETSKSLDKSCVYCDIDGKFDCTLLNVK